MFSQYEIDGSIETHNTSLPSTTACPYLPGQAVNTLVVPVEQALRQRSVSMNSMRLTDYKTMDPESKYDAPRPTPTPTPIAPVDSVPFRVGSSPLLNHKSSSRSLSPAQGAWKRFFARKLVTRDGERGRSPVRNQTPPASSHTDYSVTRCTTPSEGTRTRDISPESLRRFLSEDTPSRPNSNLSEKPALVIPEDIIEDNDDDENFASSAASETQIYATRLTPPPFKRCASSDYIGSGVANSSVLTLIPTRPSVPKVYDAPGVPASAVIPSRPRLETLSACCSPFKPATSFFHSPVSPNFTEDEGVNFFDLTDDDDDVVSSNNSDILSLQPSLGMPAASGSFECYSLPEPQENDNITKRQPACAKISPTTLLSRSNSGIDVNDGNFLGAPIDTGLDFATELGWMVNAISSKPI